MMVNKKTQRLAAVEIGDVAMRLTIADVDQGELNIISTHTVPTRLSHEVDDDGRISPDKMTQLATVLNLFANLAENFGAENFLALATHPTRIANNAEAFADFLRKRTELDVQLVSGETEAALIFRGATYNRKLHPRQLVVDIGADHTELIASSRHQVDWLLTIPIGAARIAMPSREGASTARKRRSPPRSWPRTAPR